MRTLILMFGLLICHATSQRNLLDEKETNPEVSVHLDPHIDGNTDNHDTQLTEKELKDSLKQYLEHHKRNQMMSHRRRRMVELNHAQFLPTHSFMQQYYQMFSHHRRKRMVDLHHAQEHLKHSFTQPIQTLESDFTQVQARARRDLRQFTRGYNEKQHQFTNMRKPRESTDWMENLRMPVNQNQHIFLNQWSNLMDSLSGWCSKRTRNMTDVDRKQAILTMGSSNNFMNIFWPFRFDVNVMNQRLALSGLTHKVFNGSDQDTKETFFKVIADHQNVKPPSKPSEVVYSFDDIEVMKGLNGTGMISISGDPKDANKYLLSQNERRLAIRLADEAMMLINKTDPELYQSIVQMIATLGFYKEDNPHYLGGSATSDIGIIWLNVYDLEDWTVEFMAEQIVHEFVHNSVFYAELVHGTYHRNADLSKARPMSAIRRTYRDYDKSFHAAYVSACLITLHTRIGEMGRAEELARTFRGAVADLNLVNDETGVLNRSGRAMLNFLNNYACLTRL